MLTEDEVYRHAFASRMFQEWHWFRWHFEHRLRGNNHPFAQSIVGACVDVVGYIPNYASAMIDALASIGGREKHLPHWEQLLQRLCELHVIRHVVTHPWPEGTRFEWEPTVEGTRTNPELAVHTVDYTLCIEVKAPAIFQHSSKRSQNPTQVVARVMPREELYHLPDAELGITLPRDNPVKDFLIGSESKFHPFQQQLRPFFGVLVIVWDDFIHEPISALIHPDCGLFTESSFAMDSMGKRLTFPSINSIVAIRHLHQLIRACRGEALADACRHALDYGRPGEFPFKVYLQNPDAPEVPAEILKCFQASPPHPPMGAEYLPEDLVWWLGNLGAS